MQAINEQLLAGSPVPHGTVDLPHLKACIRTLITLPETDMPVLSCYLNAGAHAALELERHRQVLRTSLSPGQRPSFDEAFERVQHYLASELRPSTKGIAVFARGGPDPCFLALQLQVPVTVRVSVDSTPMISELVQLKDTYHRYVVLIVTPERARILEVTLGSVTTDLWAVRSESAPRIGREWAHERYQNHRRNRADRFLSEKIDVLDQLMSKGGHSHLILAGDPALTARVRQALPARLAWKVIDIVTMAEDADTESVVATTLARFVAYEEKESIGAVGLLLRELRRDGLAVAGTRESIRALQHNQADMLIVARGYEAPPGWRCAECGLVELRDERIGGACSRCGVQRSAPVDLNEEMTRLAERYGVTYELVQHSERLMELGGVGCLLRYSWGWRPDEA